MQGVIWLRHNFSCSSSDWYDSLIFGADYFVKWKQTLQCLVSPHSLWLLIGCTTMNRTHWWFTEDNIYSVNAKVDKVAIKRIKDGYNKPPPSNSAKIICPFSQYQVAASSRHCMEGKENRCQSCTSSTLPQWLFVGVALLPPGQPPAAHSGASRGSPTVRPSHKAALSFAPHWHALIVMCSRE